MGLAAALLEAAARGEAGRLASLLHAHASHVNVADEVSISLNDLNSMIQHNEQRHLPAVRKTYTVHQLLFKIPLRF